MKKHSVTIECTEEQAMLIEIALDTLSRMTAGQLAEMVRGMEYMRNRKWWEIKTSSGEKLAGYSLGKFIEDFLKPYMFPELHRNESYGVGSKEIGKAQIAYEMVKKLQNFRTRNMNEAGVLKHEPLHYSKEPLIVIKEKGE